MNVTAVVELLRREVAKAPTARAWADAHRMHESYVSLVLAGHKLPGPTILDAIGVEKLPDRYRRRPKATGG